MNDESIAIALSQQLGMPYASIQNKVLRPEKKQNLQKIISAQRAREHNILPLFIDGDTLAIAMASPEETNLIHELKRMTGYNIQPFVARHSELLKVLDEFYGAEQGPGSAGTAGRPVRPPTHPPAKTDAEKKELPPNE